MPQKTTAPHRHSELCRGVDSFATTTRYEEPVFSTTEHVRQHAKPQYIQHSIQSTHVTYNTDARMALSGGCADCQTPKSRVQVARTTQSRVHERTSKTQVTLLRAASRRIRRAQENIHSGCLK